MSENEIKKCFECTDKKYIIPINLDFDGTVVTNCYPKVGDENEHCVDILKKWIDEYNVGLIIHTMRANKELDDAIKWFEERNIKLWGVQKNQFQHFWTNSPKSYGFYIDDMSVGIPLLDENTDNERVDWKKIDELFKPKLKKIYDKHNK